MKLKSKKVVEDVAADLTSDQQKLLVHLSTDEQHRLGEVLLDGVEAKKPRAAKGGSKQFSWKPEQQHLESIEMLSGQGLNQEQICHVIGIGVSTWERRVKQGYIEMEEAKKRGQSKGIAIVTNKLFELARNGNIAAICFYLKNTAGWKDRSDVEWTGKDGGPIMVTFSKLEKDL